VGDVGDRRLVGGRAVIDPELIRLGQGKGCTELHRTWITFLAIRAGARERDARAVSPGGDLGDRPELLVEALAAAVEGVGPIVDGELVFLSVEREAPLGDAVGVAADGGAEVV